MNETEFYAKLRTWAYDTYGMYKVDPDTGKRSGRIRIIKLSALGMYGEAGWPDMCVFVAAQAKRPAFVFLLELKSPERKYAMSTPIQKARQQMLRAMGFAVYEDVATVDEGQSIFGRHLGFA